MTSVLRWTIDLLAVLVLTALAVAAVVQDVGGWVRALSVVPLVLFVPGYAIVAAVFPGAPDRETGPLDADRKGLKDPRLTKSGVDGVERIAFSVVVTVVVVPLVAVGAHFSPWGVTLDPILVGVVLLTVVFAVMAILRRANLHPDDRYYPPLLFPIRGMAYEPTAATLGRRESRSWAFNVALLIAVLVFASSIGYAAVNPPEGDGFTELSVDTPFVSGSTDALYPEQFDAGEGRPLSLVLTNQEGAHRSYDLVVAVQRVDGQGPDATVRERTEVTRRTIDLADGERATPSVDVAPTMTGDDLRIAVLAYEGDAPNRPTLAGASQSLLLPIEVNDGDEAASEAGTTGNTSAAAVERVSVSGSTVAPVPFPGA